MNWHRGGRYIPRTGDLAARLREALDLAPIPTDLQIPPQGPTRPGGASVGGKGDAKGGRAGGGGGGGGMGAGMGGVGLGAGAARALAMPLPAMKRTR